MVSLKPKCRVSHLGITYIAILGLVALAFALRLYHLGAQSLWMDEIASFDLATSSLLTLGRRVARGINDHPPLYYYLLHFWILLAGRSEFALRYLSTIFGLLLIPTVYRVGHLWMGRRVALLAVLITSLAPVQVYYSQETRTYALTAILALLSFYLCTRILQDGSKIYLWVIYVLLTSLSLYTHYYTFLILAAENFLFLLWWLRRRERGSILRWVLAQMALALLFLPWAWASWQRVTGGLMESRSEIFRASPRSPLEFLGEVVVGLTLGPTITQDTPLYWAIGGLFFILLLYGALRRSDSNSRLMAVTYFFVPALLACLADQCFPHFISRHLLLVAPAYYLLLAAAMAWLPSRGVLGAFLVLAPFTYGLFNYYYDPIYSRDDYRSLYVHISKDSHPGEAIILNAPWQGGSFGYYYHGTLPKYGLPKEYPPGEGTIAALGEIASKHSGVWVVFYGNASVDPQGLVEGWLNEKGYRAQNQWFGGVRLSRYLFPHNWRMEDIPHPLDVTFDSRLGLLGYGLEKDALGAGQRIQITLFWEALQRVESDYRLSLRLLDDSGMPWAQEDYPFLEGAHPPPTWTKGELVRDQYGLTIPPGTQAGVYNLVVLVYSPDTLQPLSVNSETFAYLAQVQVEE